MCIACPKPLWWVRVGQSSLYPQVPVSAPSCAAAGAVCCLCHKPRGSVLGLRALGPWGLSAGPKYEGGEGAGGEAVPLHAVHRASICVCAAGTRGHTLERAAAVGCQRSSPEEGLCVRTLPHLLCRMARRSGRRGRGGDWPNGDVRRWCGNVVPDAMQRPMARGRGGHVQPRRRPETTGQWKQVDEETTTTAPKLSRNQPRPVLDSVGPTSF